MNTSNKNAKLQLATDQCIAITAGEPSGIGPDIILQLAQKWHTQHASLSLFAKHLTVIGDKEVLEQRAQLLGLNIEIVDALLSTKEQETKNHENEQRQESAPQIRIIDIPCAAPVTLGKPNKENAEHLLSMLDSAIDGCMNNTFSAMVTAPLSKQVINDAGIAFTGHTEYLAERTKTEQVVMLLASNELRVTLATTHIPLHRVAEAITQENLLSILRIVNKDLQKKFGITRPLIHVCGLNPHAGEGGHLGTEEITTIEPAIKTAQAEGINARGPFSADTAFSVTPQPDAFLAMFHDQGLPVLKYASFGHAVNITLGLPIIRTSVDHGTALSLAGTGQSDTGSLEAAIEAAITMIKAHNETKNG